ncbi:MAG TPA: pyruvate kinase, partial [Acidimicrobiia bacterium]
MERLTKIVATLGPAVADPDRVRQLIRAGMDVARLNFSHGDYELHRSFARWVREGADAEGRVVAVLQDIQGPKLRVGSFLGGSIHLDNDETIDLVPGRLESTDPGVVYVDYEYLVEDVEVGERIILADGLIRLIVDEVMGDRLRVTVEQCGELKDGKGVAFPETNLRVPAITEKDRRDLEFGRELEVDYVAASFVRTGADIREIRELAGGAPVIAKIELAAAYDNLDDILSESAGAMVARGDLGVQLPLERIPLVQADILERTNAAGLISITATEMLESMTHSPRPTRAEATDVANAVLTGTDAVMLSAETAAGEFPFESVRTMGRICQ